MYSIIHVESGEEIAKGRLPLKPPVPGGHEKSQIATFDMVGKESNGYRCVPRETLSKPTNYHIGGTETVTFDGTKVVVDPGWTLPDAETLKTRRIQEIKSKAGDLINGAFPDWKQRNMIAAGVELQDSWRLNGVWTADEQALSDQLKASWGWVLQVRAHSNTLEAEINALSKAEDIAVWSEHDWPTWTA